VVVVPPDEEFLTYNQGVIKEFRANEGVVTQLGFPILLLSTTGVRTGRSTTTPLGFSVDDPPLTPSPRRVAVAGIPAARDIKEPPCRLKSYPERPHWSPAPAEDSAAPSLRL
jgi:hypothetical protein